MTKRLVHIGSLAILCCGGLFISTTSLRAQERNDGMKKGPPTTAPAMSDADMQAMMKAAMPGPEHAKMKDEVGDWEATVKFMKPDGSWTEGSKGIMHMELIMDRYIQMKFKGTMDMGMGPMAYEGLGTHGYDNATQKYWSTWIDSMSTGIMKTEGTMQGDKCVLTGEMFDPSQQKMCKVKEVIGHTDATHSSYEMYVGMPNGQEMKMMEIQYVKK